MASFIMNATIQIHPRISLPKRILILTGLIIFADWLFYDQPIGMSLALFILSVAGVVVACNKPHDTDRSRAISAILLFAALLPMVGDFDFLPVIFGIVGVAYFVVVVTTWAPDRITAKLGASIKFLALGVLQCLADLIQFVQTAPRGESKHPRISGLVIWIVPTVLTGIFTALFASANPLIGDWFAHIDLWAIIAHVSVPRILFWIAALIAIWPFIFVRQRAAAGMKCLMSSSASAEKSDKIERVFGQAAIFRSIFLCNVLFAIQTMSDVTYLWIGVKLPEGLTYATYAHRGACLLIVTALLAGGFIVAAMRPGSTAEKSPLIRVLVYVWVAQNILLVLSSALRLNLYVEAYSLTVWRAAAFVWIFLVAMGLVAIVARVIFHHSNSWLISTMLYAVVVTLYICSFIDTPRVIAGYNVAHCREITGHGSTLDLAYLESLGPNVIPALDTYQQRLSALDKRSGETATLLNARHRLAGLALGAMNNWRSWTFRKWQLRHYLTH